VYPYLNSKYVLIVSSHGCSLCANKAFDPQVCKVYPRTKIDSQQSARSPASRILRAQTGMAIVVELDPPTSTIWISTYQSAPPTPSRRYWVPAIVVMNIPTTSMIEFR